MKRKRISLTMRLADPSAKQSASEAGAKTPADQHHKGKQSKGRHSKGKQRGGQRQDNAPASAMAQAFAKAKKK